MSDTPTDSKAVRPSPWLGFAKLLVPALIGALGAYQTASSGAKGQADAVKDKAEAGYQETKRAVDALTKAQEAAASEAVAQRAELEGVKRQLRLCRRGRGVAASARLTVDLASAAPAPPPVPKVALPADLDKALHAQQQATAAPQAKDGGQ